MSQSGDGNKSLLPAGRNRWIWVSVPVLVYLAFALPNLRLPGVYYDEVLQVLPAMHSAGYPVTDDYLVMRNSMVGIGRFRVPLLTTSYLGAIETFIFAVIFQFIIPTVTTMRLTFVVLGAITIVFIYIWSRQMFGHWWGLAVALLVATDASYIFYTRVDNGPVDAMLIIKLGMLIGFTDWFRTGRALGFYAGAFLLGLGVYDKANFLWLIGAGAVVLAVFAREDVLQRLRGKYRMVAIGIGLAILGSSPYLIYLVISRGGPFRGIVMSFARSGLGIDNSHFGVNFKFRLHQFVDMISGYRALLDYTNAEIAFSRFPVPLQAWFTIAAGVAAVPLYFLPATRRALPVALAVAIVLIIAFSTVTPTGLNPFHLVLIYPFQELLIVSVLIAVSAYFQSPGMVRSIGAGTVGAILLTNTVVVVQNHRVLVDTGGVGTWSDSMYNLADYLRQQNKTIVCLDWGLCNSLQMLSKGALKTTDRWHTFLFSMTDVRPMADLLKQPDTLFLFHSPHYTQVTIVSDQDYPRQTLLQTARQIGVEVRLVDTLTQRNGQPLYQIYQVVDQQ